MRKETVSDAALERLSRRSTADVRAGAVPVATVESIAEELRERRRAMRMLMEKCEAENCPECGEKLGRHRVDECFIARLEHCAALANAAEGP